MSTNLLSDGLWSFTFCVTYAEDYSLNFVTLSFSNMFIEVLRSLSNNSFDLKCDYESFLNSPFIKLYKYKLRNVVNLPSGYKFGVLKGIIQKDIFMNNFISFTRFICINEEDKIIFVKKSLFSNSPEEYDSIQKLLTQISNLTH